VSPVGAAGFDRDPATGGSICADDVQAVLEWSQRGVEVNLALGAQRSPQFVELHGALRACRG
jgi:hypothetical protein